MKGSWGERVLGERVLGLWGIIRRGEVTGRRPKKVGGDSGLHVISSETAAYNMPAFFIRFQGGNFQGFF